MHRLLICHRCSWCRMPSLGHLLTVLLLHNLNHTAVQKEHHAPVKNLPYMKFPQQSQEV